MAWASRFCVLPLPLAPIAGGRVKRPIATILLISSLCALSAQGKPIVTVLDFAVSGISAQEMKGVIGYLSIALFKTGRYTVIDMTQRDTLLKELAFSVSGCSDEACQLEIGRMLTAEMIVVGDITKLGSRYLLTARMLETETARTLNAADGSYASLDDLVVDLANFGRQLVGASGNVETATSRTTGHVDVSTVAPSRPPVSLRGEIYVKGGVFRMGSDTGASDEEPVHEVQVSDLFMMKYEVTQKDYAALMGKNPASGVDAGDSYPVCNVSWYEAVAYANRLSERDGLKPSFSVNGRIVSCDFSASGWRLPTEAEWEWAARGGNLSRGYAYAGSMDGDSVAWYSSNSGYKTQPVGSKAANELGLYDLSGNVWEWCWDWHGSYSSGPQTDPTGAASGSYRAIRGGSWRYDASYARTACRGIGDPAAGSVGLGFRLVRPGLS
jgi:formylglycine-generating enzyme required for sulfatase activity